MIILATKFNQSYVHIISSTAKLIIDNVFHNVCFLLLAVGRVLFLILVSYFTPQK